VQELFDSVEKVQSQFFSLNYTSLVEHVLFVTSGVTDGGSRGRDASIWQAKCENVTF